MFRASLVPLSFVVVICCVMALAPPPVLATAIVYDNTTNRHPLGHAWSFGAEHGDEITLAGTERIVTDFTFCYFFDGEPSGGETARIRFYNNDGAGGIPGTLLYDSTAFSIGSGTSHTLNGLAVLVPDTFIWTLEWGGTVDPFVPLYWPPTVGSSTDYLWKYQMGSWQKDFWFGETPPALCAQVKATPEPATMLLLASGLFGLAGIRRKFRKR